MKTTVQAIVVTVVAVTFILAGERRAEAQRAQNKEKAPFPYEEHVYLIRAKHGTKDIELTGFKIMGVEGIYTSLHGVVSATKIAAIDKKNNKYYEVEVSQVDVDRDIALLVPLKGTLRRGGLALGKPRSADDLEKDKQATLYGFPLRLNTLVTSTELIYKKPIRVELTKVVDEKIREDLNKRGSPDTSKPVLLLQGPMMPGHSGSPIIDKDGAVIGVACGGLNKGEAHIGWAIPFHDIELVERRKEEKRLDKLKEKEITSAYFCVLDEEARKNAKRFGIASRTIIVSDKDEPVAALKGPPREMLQKLLKGVEKGNPLEQIKILLSMFENRLALNTRVEIIETDDKRDDAKGVELPKLPIKLPAESEALIKIIAGQAFGQIDEIWVRVKVIDGPRRDDEVWILRKNLRSETVMVEQKD